MPAVRHGATNSRAGPMSRIDVSSLESAGACREGVEWVAARSQHGADRESLIVELLAEGRTDFYAWGFLRLPKLRRAGLSERMRRVLGPQHERLGELADALGRMRWLEPRGAVRDAQIASHLRRLSAFGFNPPRVLRVVTVSLADAYAATAPQASLPGVCEGSPTPEIIDDWCAAYWRSRRSLRPAPSSLASEWTGCRSHIEERMMTDLQSAFGETSRLPNVVRDVVGALVTSSYAPARRLLPRARRGAAWSAAERAIPASAQALDVTDGHQTAVVRWAARWVHERARIDAVTQALLLLADAQTASPVEPLLDIWAAGLWPAGFAGDTFYVGDASIEDAG